MSVRVPFASLPLERRRIGERPEEMRGHGLRLAVPGAERTWYGTGTWGFDLTTYGPLCIRTLFEDLENDDNPAFIPGSSLRGMFRNMVQVIGAGCAQDFGGIPAKGFEPCTASSGLCLACRLFGTVSKDPASNQETAFMGRVRVHDTAGVKVKWENYSMLGDREPGAANENTWILFETGTVTPTRGIHLKCVPEGTKFQFDVDISDLDAEEMAVLQFAITLRHGKDAFFHKLGFGKAMGLGTVALEFIDENRRVDESPMEKFAALNEVWEALREHRK